MEAEALKVLLARGQIQQPIEHPAGGLAVLVPEGYHLQHLEPVDVLKGFIKNTPAFSEIGSFIAYVNEYKDVGTKIFGDVDNNRLTAVLDYHQKASVGRVSHAAVYTARLSNEWLAWESRHDRNQGQVEFAEFIEENSKTVQSPDAATLLEIVTTLESKTDVTFQSKVKLNNGNQSLVFTENTEAKGAGGVNVPTEFILAIPIYRGGEGYQIKVFLRCDTRSGKAIFRCKIHELEASKQFAFTQLCKRAAEETDLAVLHGTAFGHNSR